MDNVHRRACRFCMKTIYNDFDVIGEITRRMLDALLLKLNLDNDKESVMCLECAAKLQNAVDFKTTCLNRNKKVCRFCMKVTERGRYVYLEENKENVFIIDMVQKHIPELNLRVTEELVTCNTCLGSLQDFLSFVRNCMSAEEKIKKNMDEHKDDDQIHLNDAQQVFTPEYEISCSDADNMAIFEEKREEYNTVIDDREIHDTLEDTMETEMETDDVNLDIKKEDVEIKLEQNICESLYYIVEFPLEINNDSAPTAIISSTWTFKDNGETFCWWPKFKSDEQRKKAVIQHRLMDIENCTPREISIKYRTDIYRKAIHKLKQLEEFSDVQTDDDGRQEKGRNTAYDDITSDASSDGSLGPLITPNAKRNKKNTLEDDRVTPQKLDPVVSVSTSPCSSCKTVERLCTNLITLVEKNGQKIENLTEIVNAVLQTKDQQPLTAEENVQLPLKSPSDMDNFEQLLTDKNEFTKKLNFLRFVGGKDIVDTTRRVIGRILSHDLALKINWSGRNDKPSFQKYKTILSLISAAVHCNPLANEASEKEIFDIIKIWLRGAIDREGGRIKRKRDNVT